MTNTIPSHITKLKPNFRRFMLFYPKCITIATAFFKLYDLYIYIYMACYVT